MEKTPDSQHSPLFFFLMILAMLSWAGSWVTARWASSYPAELTALGRFIFSALSFLPILWMRKESLALPRKSWFWVCLSALTLGIYNLLFLTAMQQGPGGFGGVLVPTLNPLFSFLLAVLFFHMKLRWKSLAGLVLGLVGGVLQILGPEFRSEAFLQPQNILLVAAALMYAILTHFSVKAQKEISVFRYSFWTALLCALLLLPFAWGSVPADLGQLKIDFWVDVAYLSLMAGTFGTTLYFEAARRVGGARASSFAFLVPILALILAFIFLGEQPTWTSILGGGLSIAAVWIISLSSKK